MDSRRSELIIGPSTGWLYAQDIYSLAQQEDILKTVGANGVEICFLGSWGSNDRRILSLKTGPAFNTRIFIHRSLHLPDINNEEPERQLSSTREALAVSGATIALTHPMKTGGDYPIACYERMISGGIPLAIENMDSRKDSGFALSELEKLVKIIECRFVLDVQHAYEHDHEMRYAGELLESLKDRLAHLHVSGEAGANIHSLVHKAANAGKIVEFISRVLSVKKVPLIFEGEYTTPGELRQEIEFLTEELGSC